MTETIDTLQDILTPLFQIQEAAWRNGDSKPKPSKRASSTYKAIYEKWIPAALEDTKFIFKSPNYVLDFSQRGKVLYLPPLHNKMAGFVPILSPCYKLNRKNKKKSTARLQVMLVRLDKNPKPVGMGFRLETPERRNQNANSTDQEGIHDFPHAQLIREFRVKQLDEPLRISNPYWLPITQPSFPLPAKCPVTLFLCLIVTLYGKKYYNQFLAEHEIFDIKQHRDILDPWIN